MSRIARKHKRRKDPWIALGAPDGRITPRAGLHLVAQLDALLSISRTSSQMAPSVKLRRRGLAMGDVVVSLAETMLLGGDFPADLDYRRTDAAGPAPRAVPCVPAWTTVMIGKRFSEEVRRGVERANAALVAAA